MPEENKIKKDDAQVDLDTSGPEFDVTLPEEKKECNGYDLKILPCNRPINNHSKHTCLLGAAGNWLLCGRSIT